MPVIVIDVWYPLNVRFYGVDVLDHAVNVFADVVRML